MRHWPRIVFLLMTVVVAVLGLERAAAAPAVSLAVSVQPGTVPAGGEVVYTITATNAGDQEVQGLVISHTLPAGFAYVPGSMILTVNDTRLAGQEPATIGRNLTWHRLVLPAARTNSTYGMHTFVQDRCENGYIDYQLDRVREVAGSGAYVKQLFYRITPQTTGPQSCWVHFVSAAYDRGLIPVVRLQGEFGGQYWLKPQPDPSGSYAAIAAAFQRVVAGLPRRENRPLYVEVWNEPNLGLEWSGTPNPAEFGRFLVDVAAAIRSLGDPRIVILNGALSPGGDHNNLAFIDAMAAVPGALQAFDVWAAHPYPGNQPPEYNVHDGTAYYPTLAIDSYKLELDRLAAHGRSGLRVLLTETGYALGACDLCFAGFPQIDEGNRADYISRALRDYWARWPEVLGVCPYELVDPYNGWYVWDWLYPDGRHHRQFDSVAGLSKQPSVAPGALRISFRATVAAKGGTYTSSVAAIAGGITLAAVRGVAAVTVEPGPPPPTPTPPPVEDPTCQEMLQNRGLEADTDWSFMGGVPAGYSTAQARAGARSLRLGLEPGAANLYSYSSAQQELALPPGLGAVTLRFWYKTVSNDTVGDRFKILVRDASQAFHTLGYLDLGASGWTHAAFDTSSYKGQSVAVRLTAVNDGYAGQTAVYLDDLSWAVCSDVRCKSFLPLAYRGGSAALAEDEAATAVLRLDPDAGPGPGPVSPLARPTVAHVEPEGGARGYRALATDPQTGLVYAVADDGVWAFDPSGEQAARRLLAGRGYQAVLVDLETRRLLASDWAAGALVALDLASGHVAAQATHLLHPSGIAVYGDSIFVAETGADQLVILDRRTCGIMRNEPVGSAPYALAVDPSAARVWVANAGGRSVTVLDAHSGVPVGAVQLDGLGHPQGVAVDSLRGRVYVTYLLSPRYHALAVIDAKSLQTERVLRGDRERPLLGAYGVAVEPGTGQLLLSDVTGLLALRPDTLAGEVVDAGHGFVLPFGLAVDPGRGRVLAVDNRSALVRVLNWR